MMVDGKVKITQTNGFSNHDNESERKVVDLQKDLHSDLSELFKSKRLSGYELADAVVKRVFRYSVACVSQSVDDDNQQIGDAGMEFIEDVMRDELKHWVQYFVIDEHRSFVVRCHARGMSTSEAAWELMNEDYTLNRLARDDALGVDILRKKLIHSLSYLKPGTARWPEQKYGNIWREAREEYKKEINNVAFTSSVEHVLMLAKHTAKINSVIEDEKLPAKELQILTNSLLMTLDGIHKLQSEKQEEENMSAPQLVAVLERLTVALDAPEQLSFSGDADVLVSALEQLTHALKTSKQNVLKTGSVEDVEVVSREGENE